MLTRILGVPNTKPSAPIVDLAAQLARIKAIASIGRARAALTAEPPVVGTITPTATAKDEPAEPKGDLGTGNG